MFIDVLLTPGEEADFKSKTTVIIDVLRASTTILSALQNGASTVQLVVTVEEALKLKEKIPTAVLGGERGGVRPTGFDLGNSPLEYSEKQIKNRELVLTTTNGTLTADKAREADNIYIGCFRNLLAVVSAIMHNGKDVILFCAGNDGRFSSDDALCAGLMIREVEQLYPNVQLSDSAIFVKQVVYSMENFTNISKDFILKFMRNTYHGRRLINLGFEEDISFCSELSRVNLLPRMKDGKFII